MIKSGNSGWSRGGEWDVTSITKCLGTDGGRTSRSCFRSIAQLINGFAAQSLQAFFKCKIVRSTTAAAIVGLFPSTARTSFLIGIFC